jgi:tripartite-type tricarboxylate transporter receptor subunit TctC
MSGEVHLTFASVAASRPHVQSGKVKALAVTGLQRSSVMPELPTLDESGVTGYNMISWHSILTPAKTPPAIVNTLYDTLRSVAQASAVKEAMSREGMEPTLKGPAGLAALIKSESPMYRDVIKAANIRPE